MASPPSAAALAIATIVAAASTFVAMRSVQPDDPARRRRALAIAIGVALATTALLVWQVDRAAVLCTLVMDDAAAETRLLAMATMFGLLAAAIATDLDSYVIPDSITLPGTLAGLTIAAVTGRSQLVHLWTDWRVAIPRVRGPAVPAWIDSHPHWHGVAFSLSGAAVGLGVMLALRGAASRVMRQEAMGAGDATLMMMVGSFVGWQPTLIAIFAAPILGVGVAVLTRLVTGRTLVAFGPYLAAATFGMVAWWEPVWMFGAERELRQSPELGLLFSDLVVVVGTLVGIVAATAAALFALRLLRPSAD